MKLFLNGKYGEKRFTKIDRDDFEKFKEFKWFLSVEGYAFRSEGLRKIYLHREISQCPEGLITDHKNGNSLDNRKRNLRNITRQQNSMNRKPSKNGTSQYKGVSFSKKAKKWKAAIGLNGKKIHLGYFKEEKEAALAYNEASKKYHEEFGMLNIVK